MGVFPEESCFRRVPGEVEDVQPSVARSFPRNFHSYVSRKVNLRRYQQGGDPLKKILTSPVTSRWCPIASFSFAHNHFSGKWITPTAPASPPTITLWPITIFHLLSNSGKTPLSQITCYFSICQV